LTPIPYCRFLITQIIFHLGCLTLSTIKTLAVTYDIAEAKRSTTTSHPSAVKTYAILRDLWQVSLQNALIVVRRPPSNANEL
jgi:hypothetical protein